MFKKRGQVSHGDLKRSPGISLYRTRVRYTTGDDRKKNATLLKRKPGNTFLRSRVQPNKAACVHRKSCQLPAWNLGAVGVWANQRDADDKTLALKGRLDAIKVRLDLFCRLGGVPSCTVGCGNASWAVQHRTIRTPERKTASARGETSRRIISTADGLRGDAKGTDVKTHFFFFFKTRPHYKRSFFSSKPGSRCCYFGFCLISSRDGKVQAWRGLNTCAATKITNSYAQKMRSPCPHRAAESSNPKGQRAVISFL